MGRNWQLCGWNGVGFERERQKGKKVGWFFGQNDEKHVCEWRTNVGEVCRKITANVRGGETKAAEKPEKSRPSGEKRHDFSEQLTVVIAGEFR